MSGLQFILFEKEGLVFIEGESRVIPTNHIVVAEENSVLINDERDNFIIITCHPVNLLLLYQEIVSTTVAKYACQSLTRNRFKILPLDHSVMESTKKLMLMDKNLSISFLYLYCLSIDKLFFAGLLRQFIGLNLNDTLLDFFEKNYFKQWSVTRYAQELELSVHKLNVFFVQIYGMPVKKWLIEKRLKRGSELLLTSTLRVADIALECGFCNHAHFSTLFRRYFHVSPSLFREQVRKG